MSVDPRNTEALRQFARDARLVRVLVRQGAKSWPELHGKILVYLLDSEDVRTNEVSVYLPDDDAWISVDVGTIGANTRLTITPSRAQIDRAVEAIGYELGAKVRVMRSYGGQGSKPR